MQIVFNIFVLIAGLITVVLTLSSAVFTVVLPRADREQVGRDFARWRVNYDRALILLCGLVWRQQRPGRVFALLSSA